MLIQHAKRDVDSSSALQTAKATIKASSKIFGFFADNVYSNKPVAIVRELAANAWDSHVVSGNGDKPIEIWLPSLVSPEFKIQDFGTGMSHDFVMTGYMAYADGSTKHHSDTQIGGFGIGKAATLSYTDQYTLKSVHEGVVSLYSIYKDEDGIPSVALLAQKTTDEPNGVTITFPVEVADFKKFEEATFSALRYFDPLPIIHNAAEGAFSPPQYSARGKTWGMRKTHGNLNVIMGGVAYPVTDNSLSWKVKNQEAKKLLGFGLDLYVSIGTCSVALSREALSYDDRTIAALESCCMKVIDEVAASFSTMFDNEPSLYNAKVALYEEVYPTSGNTYGIGTRGSFLADRAVYKGQKLEMNHSFMLPGGMATWELEKKQWRRRNSLNPKWENWNVHPLTIQPGKFEKIIIDDLPRSPKSKVVLKMKEFIEDQPQDKGIFVIRPNDENLSVAKILQALGDPSDDLYVLTSTLPEPSANLKLTKNGAVRAKIRMFTYNGYKGYNYSAGSHGYHDTLNPGRYGKSGVKEVAYNDQPLSGIVVEMENFKPDYSVYKKLEIGLIAWDEVHFVNKGDRPKLNDQWVNFEDEFKKRLDAKLAAMPELGARLAVEQAMPYEYKKVFQNNTFTYVSKRQEASPFAKLEETYRRFIVPLTPEQRKYAPYVTIALPKGVDPAKSVEDFKAKHPQAHRLLELLNFSELNTSDTKFFLEIL